jgi:two-component system response regulator PilR (NtrC family)
MAFSSHSRIDVQDLALKIPSDPCIDMHPLPVPPTPVELAQPQALADHAAVNVAVNAALPSCLPEHLECVERELILRALAKTRFNRTQAAILLGISFRQLRYRMQRLAIQERD